MLNLFDREMRRDPWSDPRYTWETIGPIVRITSPSSVSYENGVLYSRDATPAVVDESIAYFTALGKDFEWKLYEHDKPQGIAAWLEARGFKPDPLETVMTLDTSAPISAPPADLVRITDPVQLGGIIAIQESVWKLDLGWLRESLTASMKRRPEDLAMYVAMCDGKPASTAWAWFRPGHSMGQLCGGTTLPEFRKKGLYRALVAVRAAEAKRRGVKYLSVEASSESRPILEKIGFQRLTSVVAWRYLQLRPV